jgi:hypothetical protein
MPSPRDRRSPVQARHASSFADAELQPGDDPVIQFDQSGFTQTVKVDLVHPRCPPFTPIVVEHSRAQSPADRTSQKRRQAGSLSRCDLYASMHPREQVYAQLTI